MGKQLGIYEFDLSFMRHIVPVGGYTVEVGDSGEFVCGFVLKEEGREYRVSIGYLETQRIKDPEYARFAVYGRDAKEDKWDWQKPICMYKHSSKEQLFEGLENFFSAFRSNIKGWELIEFEHTRKLVGLMEEMSKK